MENLNYNNRTNRGVTLTKAEAIGDWLADFSKRENMAIYGGSLSKRNRIVLEAIARCYGNIGVIIIHNNPGLINDISRIIKLFPGLYQRLAKQGGRVSQCHISGDNMLYEPLYGMNRERIVETIYPQLSMDNPSYMQQHKCSDALNCYIDILEGKNEIIDLDAILSIVNMDVETIEKECFSASSGRLGASSYEQNDVSVYDRERIFSLLKQDNISFQVRADVNAFASHLDGRIWQKRHEEATNVSIISAVEMKNILSIYTPSNTYVLDYLASEINSLMDKGKHFMLVLDSINVSNTVLNTQILKAPTLPFSVVLSADSIQSVFGDSENDAQYSLHKMNTAVIMNCPNAKTAEVYSGSIGQYLRQFESVNNGTSQGAFSPFAGMNKGTGIHEQLFDRIRPEEFTTLEGGAVLLSQDEKGFHVVKTNYLG